MISLKRISSRNALATPSQNGPAAFEDTSEEEIWGGGNIVTDRAAISKCARLEMGRASVRSSASLLSAPGAPQVRNEHLTQLQQAHHISFTVLGNCENHPADGRGVRLRLLVHGRTLSRRYTRMGHRSQLAWKKRRPGSVGFGQIHRDHHSEVDCSLVLASGNGGWRGDASYSSRRSIGTS